jgi:beta-glucosidase
LSYEHFYGEEFAVTDYVFPTDFLWGAATSSYQVEGAAFEDDRGESVWDRFCRIPGKVLNGDNGDIACDHYHRYRQDISIMKELGLKSYRFSIAWPRIFPGGRGKVNTRGVDFYQSLVECLLQNDIEPFVTLYHWDLPQALQDMGGWGNRDTIGYFTEYAERMFTILGDRVKYWITHNEPSSAAFLGYGLGENAPGLEDLSLALQASHNILLSHAGTVQVFRSLVRRGKIGISLYLSPIHSCPESGDHAAVRLVDGIYNRWFLDPVLTARYPADMMDLFRKVFDSPVINPGDMELLALNPVDFVGVNYYTRIIVKKSESANLLGYDMVSPKESKYTSCGWEIHPEGLYELLERLKKDYGNPLVYITENGAAFRDDEYVGDTVLDFNRLDYMKKHLIKVNEAINDGARVAGYFAWSLLDNFEWAEGYSQRFGMVRVNYKTLERSVKSSGYWYRDVIAGNALHI